MRSPRRLRAGLVWLALTALVGLCFSAAVLAATPQEWKLVVPEGKVFVQHFELSPRVADLNGKTIGLYWNGKPNGDELLERTAELLAQKYPQAKFVEMWKTNPATKTYYLFQQKDFKSIIKPYDLVISSVCD